MHLGQYLRFKQGQRQAALSSITLYRCDTTGCLYLIASKFFMLSRNFAFSWVQVLRMVVRRNRKDLANREASCDTEPLKCGRAKLTSHTITFHSKPYINNISYANFHVAFLSKIASRKAHKAKNWSKLSIIINY